MTDSYINEIQPNRAAPTNYEAIARNDFCDKSIHTSSPSGHYILVRVTARLSHNLITIFNSPYENCDRLFRCNATIIIARYTTRRPRARAVLTRPASAEERKLDGIIRRYNISTGGCVSASVYFEVYPLSALTKRRSVWRRRRRGRL